MRDYALDIIIKIEYNTYVLKGNMFAKYTSFTDSRYKLVNGITLPVSINQFILLSLFNSYSTKL